MQLQDVNHNTKARQGNVLRKAIVEGTARYHHTFRLEMASKHENHPVGEVWAWQVILRFGCFIIYVFILPTIKQIQIYLFNI